MVSFYERLKVFFKIQNRTFIAYIRKYSIILPGTRELISAFGQILGRQSVSCLFIVFVILYLKVWSHVFWSEPGCNFI